MKHQNATTGFSLVLVLVGCVVLVGVGLTLAAVTRRQPTNKRTTITAAPQRVANPYQGWQVTCDTVGVKACFRLPANWQSSPYGGFQNSAQTAYVNYNGQNNKDQASDTAYIVQIADVSQASLHLKIVGMVYHNQPSYTVLNAADTTSLVANQTATIATVNPQFQRQLGEHMSFTATPGAVGLQTITNFDQAKAWFSSPEAQTCLRVLESFYYQ